MDPYGQSTGAGRFGRASAKDEQAERGDEDDDANFVAIHERKLGDKLVDLVFHGILLI